MESTSNVVERDEVWFVTVYMKLKSEILHLGQCVLHLRYRHVYKIVTLNILCKLSILYKIRKVAHRCVECQYSCGLTLRTWGQAFTHTAVLSLLTTPVA